MAQSEQSKKVIEFNWLSVLIILLFASACVYLGVNSSRLSKKDEINIAVNAVLKAQRDSVKADADRVRERVKILEAEVEEANKNTASSDAQVLAYRLKYKELLNKPEVHDTIKVVECDQLVERYDNYVTILKANVLSYSKLTDTLQLENKYLLDAYGICVTLSTNQEKQISDTRAKLRRSKILNFGLAGTLAGAVVALLVVN